MNTTQMAALTDDQVLDLYEHYSEECWAASFMQADGWRVEGFIIWLEERSLRNLREDYETAMILLFRDQVSKREVQL